ncbi:hypothetical protein OC842_001349 [Tilletia horrida]|uniref:Uncharacterized protein n=1 Tax=Tilletia horrida TaxID=155126 RepID=A0AAN6JMB3_9BASI|nr:hypothetical protein OC842_001349 [Tilletia horrida]
MPAPTSILSKRTTHPYPIHIPARASSATHLPLFSPSAEDDDNEDEDSAAQEHLMHKLKPETRRRVSFDLNAILHPAPPQPAPGEHDDDDDDDEEEMMDELPPLRSSSLTFSSQPLATQSSPDLFSLSAFPLRPSSSASLRPAPTSPTQSHDSAFPQRTRNASAPLDSTCRPLGLISLAKARKLRPIISIKAPLPAKAKVARRHALAQRHAAALELMLCGSATEASHSHSHSHAHAHAHAAAPAHHVKTAAQAGKETAGENREAQSAITPEARPKPARRWSLFPRTSTRKAEEDSTPVEAVTPSSTEASDEADRSLDSTASSQKQDTPVSTRHGEPTPSPQLKAKQRFPLLRRVSPASKDKSHTKEKTTPPFPSSGVGGGGGLTPKQIRNLKAALMDMDLANGIIGELRARSLDPLQALLASSSKTHPEAGAGAGAGAEAGAEAPTAHGEQAQTAQQAAPGLELPRPRCVLGPLLPPLEYALASSTGNADSGAAKGLHERGTSGGGSRDDSALPDRVLHDFQLDVPARVADAGKKLKKQKQLRKGVAVEGGKEKDKENRQEGLPASGGSAEHSHSRPSAARRSLANILNRVRTKSTSSAAASTSALAPGEAATAAKPSALPLAAVAEAPDPAAATKEVLDALLDKEAEIAAAGAEGTGTGNATSAVVVTASAAAAAAIFGLAAVVQSGKKMVSPSSSSSSPATAASASAMAASSIPEEPESEGEITTTTTTTTTTRGAAKDQETAPGTTPQLGLVGAVTSLADAVQPPTIFGMSPISLAFSPRTTIVTQVAVSSGAFDALADLSSAVVHASATGEGDGGSDVMQPGQGQGPTMVVGFPTDRLSFVVHWWGYEILLPPLAMAHLSTAQSISSAFLSFLQTMAISASLPEMLPFIKYISMWVELEFRAIREQDARGGGKGVVLAATWVMPMALVPRAWDLPVAPAPAPLPAAPPASAQQQRPSPTDEQALPQRGGSSGGGGAFPSLPPPPSPSFGRDLRNRMDGRPAVPAKDAYEPPLPSLPPPALPAHQIPRFPSSRPSFGSGTPALLPIPVRF